MRRFDSIHPLLVAIQRVLLFFCFAVTSTNGTENPDVDALGLPRADSVVDVQTLLYRAERGDARRRVFYSAPGMLPGVPVSRMIARRYAGSLVSEPRAIDFIRDRQLETAGGLFCLGKGRGNLVLDHLRHL